MKYKLKAEIESDSIYTLINALHEAAFYARRLGEKQDADQVKWSSNGEAHNNIIYDVLITKEKNND